MLIVLAMKQHYRTVLMRHGVVLQIVWLLTENWQVFSVSQLRTYLLQVSLKIYFKLILNVSRHCNHPWVSQKCTQFLTFFLSWCLAYPGFIMILRFHNKCKKISCINPWDMDKEDITFLVRKSLQKRISHWCMNSVASARICKDI